jgi:hypothetical protein
MESKMLRKLLLTLPLLVLPDMALAEMGGGTDRDRVNLQVQAMMRDGRWERAIAEGRANRQAFEALRQAKVQISQPATGYTASDVAGRRTSTPTRYAVPRCHDGWPTQRCGNSLDASVDRSSVLTAIEDDQALFPVMWSRLGSCEPTQRAKAQPSNEQPARDHP